MIESFVSQTLTRLNFASNNIGDTGAHYFFEAFKNVPVSHLFDAHFNYEILSVVQPVTRLFESSL